MHDEYSEILVQRIRLLCKQRGITAYQLANMSGIRYSTLENLLNRKTFNPKIKTLQKIANGFSMTLAEFLDFPDLNHYSFEDRTET